MAVFLQSKTHAHLHFGLGLVSKQLLCQLLLKVFIVSLLVQAILHVLLDLLRNTTNNAQQMYNVCVVSEVCWDCAAAEDKSMPSSMSSWICCRQAAVNNTTSTC